MPALRTGDERHHLDGVDHRLGPTAFGDRGRESEWERHGAEVVSRRFGPGFPGRSATDERYRWTCVGGKHAATAFTVVSPRLPLGLDLEGNACR